MKTIILIVVLSGLLIGSVIWAARYWAAFGEVQFGAHGIIALVLGVLLSLALGIGLMFLVFYSNRHGHDDEVGK